MEKRLEDVEIRMVYLESTIESLNQVVIKQQDQVDLLLAEIQRLKQQIEEGAELIRPLSEETPPPHY